MVNKLSSVSQIEIPINQDIFNGTSGTLIISSKKNIGEILSKFISQPPTDRNH